MKNVKSMILVSTLIAGAIISAMAFAQPKYPFTRTYYSDASHTTIVGFYSQGCTSSGYTGQVTNYYTTVEDESRPCWKRGWEE